MVLLGGCVDIIGARGEFVPMGVPKFEEMMLPVLKIINDGEEYSYREVEKKLCEVMSVSEEDREVKTSNNLRAVYYRLGWAKWHLKRHGLIGDKTGKFQISNVGTDLLRDPPSGINLKFLKEKYPVEVNVVEEEAGDDVDVTRSPNELIDDGSNQINQMLVEDLRVKMSGDDIDPTQFEKIVSDVLRKLEYNVKRVGQSNDGGVDIEISRDEFGLDMMYCQVKQYVTGNVGPDKIRDFAGALSIKKAKYGIFVTLSDFTAEAKNTAKSISDKTIRLINGKDLINLMIEHDVGVREERVVKIKKIDDGYFEEPGVQ